MSTFAQMAAKRTVRPLLDGLWSAVDAHCALTIAYVQKGFNMKDRPQQTLFNVMVYQLKTRFYRGGSDADAYTFIHEFMNLCVYPIYGYPNNESQGRADSRCRDIQSIFQQSGVVMAKGAPLLDLGCSAGSITVGLGESLGVAPENRYGVDVLPPEKVAHAEGFTYLQVPEEAGVAPRLPFHDASIGVVVMLMSLHHIKDPEGYMQEATRVLVPGGVVILKEHDVDGVACPEVADALDALHGLYSIAWARTGEQEDAAFPRGFYASYRSKEAWTKLATDNGLERVRVPEVEKWYTMSACHRDFRQPHGRIRNAAFSYWAMFVKP
jgi:ubiquinone/menaquinone biosynthesis C-methylase UbiE